MGQDYDQRLRAVSALLYKSDPLVMGASISAPDDEYDAMAARLLSLLRDVKTVDQCERVLEGEGVVDKSVARALWEILRHP